ncbi:MAG: Unknown protein [uncultured Sulfurovum sp.]|uniref:N-hydroxyarylamine O-acetyltransferase n=1 Tax=uncultured Sulfurovum sp. TaxID=269237 RepID=A0A6S6SB37_9BACT|nr:MAG: Unknown protein [uncultured Sulfurovum sp.]
MISEYLKVLGFTEDIKDLEDIEKLMKKHVSTFAFSSMSVVLKDEISLELGEVYKKVVLHKRGAYCFEHNKIFYEVLKHLGFDVEYHIARVVNNREVEAPLTHRFTILNYENERYLVDVGFGYYCPVKPIKFVNVQTEAQLGYVYRVHQDKNNNYALQVIHHDKWFTFYTFDLRACYEVDFELAHFYSHKHSDAVFVNNLVVSRIMDECIYSLRNAGYQKVYRDRTENIHIESLEQFSKVLEEELNLCFDIDERKDIYEKFIHQGINK